MWRQKSIRTCISRKTHWSVNNLKKKTWRLATSLLRMIHQIQQADSQRWIIQFLLFQQYSKGYFPPYKQKFRNTRNRALWVFFSHKAMILYSSFSVIFKLFFPFICQLKYVWLTANLCDYILYSDKVIFSVMIKSSVITIFKSTKINYAFLAHFY